MTETTGLLDAQCWLWGQDLRCPAGNLLAAWGMTRGVLPGDGGHRTYYRAPLDGERTVVAWSAGMLVTDPHTSLFLARTRFTASLLPGATPGGAVPDLDAATRAPVLADLRLAEPLLSVAAAWTAEYESFVLRHAGRSWRVACAERWDVVEAEARRLAAEVDVAYDPLPPLPRDGLGGAWSRFRTRLLAASA